MRRLRNAARATCTVIVMIAACTGSAWAEDATEGDGDAPRRAPVAGSNEPPEAYEGADAGIIAEELAEDEIPVVEFGEVIVTATRLPKLEVRIPRATNVVREQRIRERGVTSAVDALDDQVGIWVEKRTAHTSDPVIRGLSGGNLLALVDGNTLSTFWGEGGFAGDDMYGKINADNLERIEVVRGPGSVLYGSNALGAVINFITKESPFDYTKGGTRLGAFTSAQANTSPSGWRLHQETYGATRNLRWFGGVSYIDYGSTRDGSGEEQSPTDARGWYGDLALNWKISPEVLTKFTVQVAELDPVYRFYRPTESNANQRIAVAGRLDLPNLGRRTGLADSMKVHLYYQNKEDERFWHDALTGVETRRGKATWNTIQAGFVANKRLGCHDLTYGADFQSTAGESPDDEQFTEVFPDGRKVKAAPDSVWWSLGGYAHDEWRFAPDWTLTGSFRFDMLRFTSEADEFYHSPGALDPSADEFTEWQPAFAGGLQVEWEFYPDNSVYGGWARGFRQFAPKFGVTQHAYGVLVPNGLLTPITADQFELGYKHRTEYVSADAVGYYTLYNNFQNVVRGTFQGKDWYDFNESGVRDPDENVYHNTGDGEAYLYGVELAATVNLAAVNRRLFGEAWTLHSSFTWNYGQDTKNDIPLRHTQPMAAVVRARWAPKVSCEPFAEIEGRFVDRFDRIPPDRLAGDVGYLEDPQDASKGMRRTWGLPGYSVWDLRAGIRLGERVELVLGLGNLFDKLYRPAHARWDAPGRNVYASVSYTW